MEHPVCLISPAKADILLPAQKWKLHEWQRLTYGQHRANDRKVVVSGPTGCAGS